MNSVYFNHSLWNLGTLNYSGLSCSLLIFKIFLYHNAIFIYLFPMKDEQLVSKKKKILFDLPCINICTLTYYLSGSVHTKQNSNYLIHYKKTSFVFKYFLIHFISAMLRDFILGFNP